MSSLNKVMIIGRLGQDPELKYTGSGNPVCNMNVATSEKWKDKNSGQLQERTEWHRITVWGKRAELCNQYLSKGRLAYIEGKLQTRSWEDKDGNKRYATDIVADDVTFLPSGNGSNSDSSSNGGSSSNSSGNESSEPQSNSDFTADDIPF